MVRPSTRLIGMRILHIENTAGVGWQIAQGQRALGHQAEVLETYRGRIHFEHDHENYYEGAFIPIKMLRTLLLARHYDIVHMHSGIALKRIDIPAIKRLLRKPLVVHYHGSETRMGYGMYRQGLADAKIVATPDLLQWHPEAIYVPIPQTPLEYHYEFDGRLKVLHAPTDRRLKGTDLILEAIDKTKEEGVPFDFTLVEGATHEELLERFRHNNVYIDRVIAEVDGKPIETMGVAPLEAMSTGNAVIMHINDQYLPFYEGGPVINVRPTVQSLVSSLRELTARPEGIRELGEKGAKYVAETRDPKVIAQMCLDIYEQVLARRGRPAGMV